MLLCARRSLVPSRSGARGSPALNRPGAQPPLVLGILIGRSGAQPGLAIALVTAARSATPVFDALRQSAASELSLLSIRHAPSSRHSMPPPVIGGSGARPVPLWTFRSADLARCGTEHHPALGLCVCFSTCMHVRLSACRLVVVLARLPSLTHVRTQALLAWPLQHSAAPAFGLLPPPLHLHLPLPVPVLLPSYQNIS